MIDAMINRPVIDMTNVEGKYDISPEVSMKASTPAPSIFSAVQKLGLKLDSRKAPLNILIVDAAEKPTEN